MAKSKDKRLAVTKRMPPLRKSEVLKWVIGRHELVNALISTLEEWGCITYDPETHTWQGVDYEAD